jgi:outer membrane receptor protein involved in Fe transport
LNGLATYADEESTQTGTTTVNNVGYRTDAMTLVGVPRWSGNVSAQYDLNAWMFYLQAEFISGVKNQRATDLFFFSDNDIPGYSVLNATVQYQLNDSIRLFGGVDNVMDKDFPVNAGPSTQPFSGTGSASFYDRIGRRFKLGVRVNF